MRVTRRPPRLDGRDRAALLRALLTRVPGYTPEWRPQPGTAGHALLAIDARYLEVLLAGLNGTPERNRLAFLEMLGNSCLPAQSARAPLTFKLLDNAPLDVTLPAHSQVAAKVPPPPPSLLEKTEAAAPPAPLFFTEQTVTLTRGKLAAFYSVDPEADAFADHLGDLTSGFTLFDGLGPVPHVLYLGHDELFRLAGVAEVTLSVDFGAGEATSVGAAAIRRPLLLDWEYLSQDGWLPLRVDSDSTARFTQDGTITLAKDCGPDAKQAEIRGLQSYWIRGLVSTRRPSGKVVSNPPNEVASAIELEDASQFLPGDVVTVNGTSHATILTTSDTGVTLDALLRDVSAGARLTLLDSLPPLRPEGTDTAGALPIVDTIRARVGFSKAGLAPDSAYVDTAPLLTANAFHPFGPQPGPYVTFYLGSEEVFQRHGARVNVDVKLAQKGVADTPLALSYEFFDGSDWATFGPNHEFADDTASLTQDGSLRFLCPQNWMKTTVNGEESYWLRVRIDAGDYGHPLRLKVTPDGTSYKVESEAANLTPPVVSKLTLRYTYFTQPTLLDHCLAENDFAITDHSDDCRWPRRLFQPFVPIGDRQPAVHLGFTQKLPTGLLGLFVSISRDDDVDLGPAPFVWEYRSSRGWTELPLRDETLGFASSGMIQFVGPADAVPIAGMGDALYRIRARLKPGLRPQPLAVDGLWLNAVWASQGESITTELLGLGDGTPNQSLRFAPQRVPVLAGEVIEVREWSGRGEDWETAVQDAPASDVRLERDPVTREPVEAWVRWWERPHLYASGPGDRHYVLERAGGRLMFGDQRHGRIAPAAARIVASYITGGDLRGNVAVGQISELRTGAGYIESVSNPLPARGGAATETLASFGARAPQRLRHRERCVAASDYEWLAREASPEVARCRCLPLTGPDGHPLRGWVSLIVIPRSNDPRPLPARELLDRVRRFIDDRLPAGIAPTLRLLSPTYTVASIAAHIVPVNADEAALVEARVRDRLARHLHPLTGGSGGTGWDFGQPLDLSEIAYLIESTPGVDYTGWLRLKSGDAFVDEQVAVPPDALLAGGDHQLTLMVGGGPDAG